MKNTIYSILAVALLASLTVAASACDYTYTGSLSSSSGGIHATGVWGPINLSWTVTGDEGGAWHYAYTLRSNRKNISHFLLETSSTFTSQNIWCVTGPIQIQTWTQQQGNPQMPDSLYGIKFNWGGSSCITYQFDSNRAPMWGDFYTKDGTGNYAWNVGFTHPDTDPSGLPANGSLLNHVLVPDTHEVTDVPEPGSMALGLLALGATLGGAIRRRRAAKRK